MTEAPGLSVDRVLDRLLELAQHAKYVGHVHIIEELVRRLREEEHSEGVDAPLAL